MREGWIVLSWVLISVARIKRAVLVDNVRRLTYFPINDDLFGLSEEQKQVSNPTTIYLLCDLHIDTEVNILLLKSI